MNTIDPNKRGKVKKALAVKTKILALIEKQKSASSKVDDQIKEIETQTNQAKNRSESATLIKSLEKLKKVKSGNVKLSQKLAKELAKQELYIRKISQ